MLEFPAADLLQAFNALAQSADLQGQFDNALAKRVIELEKLVRRMSASIEKLERRSPAVYVEDQLVLTRVLNRFLIYADARDMGVTPHLVTQGEWEPGITAFLLDAIKPGMTIVDVGANIGYFTLLAANAAGEKGTVYAFEPLPRNFEILQRNIIVNWYSDRVRCFPYALLDRTCKVTLRTAPRWPCSSSLFLAEVQGTPVSLDENVSVRAEPLDEVIDCAVDVMKIDAEGSEPFVLAGMTSLLARSPEIQIVMEINIAALRAAGYDARDFIEQLKNSGFALQQLTWDGKILSGDDMNLFAYPLNTVILRKSASTG